MRFKTWLAAAATTLFAMGIYGPLADTAAADAPPASMIIAGTGTPGSSGDGGPATAAQLSDLAGLSVDPSGRVDLYDIGERQIRQIDQSTGLITSIVGNGNWCSDIAANPALPITGMCPGSGLATASDGTIYYGDSYGISKSVGGISTHYAGSLQANFAPSDDGPQASVYINSSIIRINPTTQQVYYLDSQGHGIRRIDSAGNVTTAIGSAAKTADCSVVAPTSNVPAVGACLMPLDFAFHNDDIYLVDRDNNGAIYILLDHAGTITVIAGNGTNDEAVVDGPAAGKALPDLRALAVASDGTVFVAGSQRGRIWKITTDGVWQLVTEFAGAIPFMDTDANGNLYANLKYSFQVVKLIGVSSVPVTVTPPAPVTPPSILKWVALGDSFSSGEGNPPFITGTNVSGNKCHRSMDAYPEVVVKQSSKYSLDFHACSGAVIDDFYLPNANNAKESTPQLNWLSADTNIVTLTIGGNDAGFAKIMAYCATRTSADTSCQKKFQKTTDAKIVNMGPKYDALIRDIKNAAPNAKVYLLGYPRFFPTKPPRSCATGALEFSFQQSDMQWINAEIKKLDTTIKTSSIASGVSFIDVYDMVGMSHTMCSADSWFNLASVPIAYSYHPNKNGQAAFATILSQALSEI